MLSRTIVAGVIGLLIATRVPAQEIPGYSIAPLLERPRIPYSTVPERIERRTQWMKENYPSLTRDRYSEAQTAVYELVDAILKQRAIERRAEFTEKERRAFHTLFGWGHQLGAYGADQIAAHFAGGDSSAGAAGREPPDLFRVTLEYPYMVVSEDTAAWRLRFPFYFTINNLNRAPAPSGGTMTVVGIDTSFALAFGSAGHAVARITFAHAPDADPEAFDTMWLSRHGMNTEDEEEPPLPGSRNFKVTESRLSLRMETTLFHDATGSYAFTYMGRFGVYEVNRVSYLDFMRFVIEENKLGPSQQ